MLPAALPTVLPTVSPSVLIVDDVVDIVDEFLTLMQLNDIATVGAHDLDSAIAALVSHQSIRLVFCDVRLASETGLEIINRIEQHDQLSHRSFAYVFFTGDDVDRLGLLVDHKHLILTKPVEPATLIRVAAQCLDAAHG